jgi:methyl-accepting chemotaxis protein
MRWSGQSSNGATPATPQAGASQLFTPPIDSLSTFQFCQNRLLASIEEIKKVAQDLSSATTRNESGLENTATKLQEFITSAREVDGERQETFKEDGVFTPPVLLI